MSGSLREIPAGFPIRRASAWLAVALLVTAGCGGKAPGGGSGDASDSAATPAASVTPADSGAMDSTGRRDSLSQAPTPPASTAQDTTKARTTATAKPTTPPRTSPVARKRTPAAAAPSTSATADTNAGEAAAPAAAAPAPSAATSASAELRDAYHQAPRDTVAQNVYDGWKQFNLNCARCHGEDVAGTTIAPHLIVSLKPNGPINTKELFVQTVCAGRPAKGMPAWCSLGLEMEKINDIYLYVKGRSDAKISPGRPAVKSGG